MVDDDKQKTGAVARWKKRLSQERKAHEKFRKQAKESQEAARDEKNKKHTYNIHWSNCRITAAAVYAKPPKADVRRRFQKPDAEEKELARAVERALDYSIDVGRFEVASRAVVRDYVRSGLGVPRIVYDVETGPMELTPEVIAQFAPDVASALPPGTLESLDTAALGEMLGDKLPEEITLQAVDIEHVPWSCFGWEPGHSDWSKVNWVWFKSYSSRKQIKEEYGKDVSGGDDESDSTRDSKEYGDEVAVYEIWHKPSKMVHVITPNHPEPLDSYKDELDLQGFFPCPRPMMDNLKSDELVPKPDYCFVESQINELQRIAQERKALAAKIRPVYICDSKDSQQVQDALDTAGGGVVPISGMVERLGESGGSLLQPVDLSHSINGLQVLDSQLDNVKQQVYEILGISDIIRGASQASETATAQQIKSNWANVRLNEKQSEVNRCWRETMRIMAEIICEHFEPQQVTLMTGVDITPRMIEMMRSDIGRNYAIDVETDSTVITDDQEERQQKMELVGNLMDKMNNLLPAVQQGSIPAEFAIELISFSIQNYKGAKQLEDAIQSLQPNFEALQNFNQQMEQVQQQLQQSQMESQQLGQQLQQAQGQLAQVNEREEGRKDAELQLKMQEAQRSGQVEGMDKEAEARLDHAKAAEIELRTTAPFPVPFIS